MKAFFIFLIISNGMPMHGMFRQVRSAANFAKRNIFQSIQRNGHLNKSLLLSRKYPAMSFMNGSAYSIQNRGFSNTHSNGNNKNNSWNSRDFNLAIGGIGAGLISGLFTKQSAKAETPAEGDFKFPRTLKELEQLTDGQKIAMLDDLAIVSNFEKFIESDGGILLIENIIENDPSARQQITSCIIKNFDRLIGSWNGIFLIENIIKNDPSAGQQIIPCIINNFDRLIESWDGGYLIGDVIEKYPDAKQQIIPCIINNFDRLIESRNGRFLIKEVQIISYIKENYKEKKITKLPLSLFSDFCEESPHDECLRSRLREDSHEYGIEGVIKRILYLKSCPEGKNDRLKSSLPTVKHIERYRKIIIQFIENNDFSSNFLSMLDRAFKKEVELEKSGYVAFKHGQWKGYGLSEKWFTTLWAITKEKPVTDFIFLHIKPLAKDDNLTDETEMREQLLRSGISSDDDRSHLLFMNYALFGNTDKLGSSSIWYATKYKSCPINISLKNVFNYFGHEDIYKKHEKQLEGLEQEYQGLSKYGSMVVVGVPEDRLADCVYLTNCYGGKQKIDIEGIGETDDIKTIITTLRHAPEKIFNSDELEFVLIMTQDKHGGLNPESGIKVQRFDAADPEKLAAFRKKERLLLEQIKQEIKQEKS